MIGASQVARGQTADAEQAFAAAIEIARRTQTHFLGMCYARDALVLLPPAEAGAATDNKVPVPVPVPVPAVAAERRLAAVGRAIAEMPGADTRELAGVLGHGIEPLAAVAAFHRT